MTVRIELVDFISLFIAHPQKTGSVPDRPFREDEAGAHRFQRDLLTKHLPELRVERVQLKRFVRDRCMSRDLCGRRGSCLWFRYGRGRNLCSGEYVQERKRYQRQQRGIEESGYHRSLSSKVISAAEMKITRCNGFVLTASHRYVKSWLYFISI